MSAFATAIVEFTSCSVVKVGIMGKQDPPHLSRIWPASTQQTPPKRRVKAKLRDDR